MTRRATITQADIQRAIRAARNENAGQVIVQRDAVLIDVNRRNPPPLSTADPASYPQGPRLRTADEALAEIDRWAR